MMTTESSGSRESAHTAAPMPTPVPTPVRWGRCTVVTLSVVAAWVLGTGVLTGWSAAGSALLGGVVVVGVLAATPLILGPLVRAMPGMAMAVALLFFMIKATLLAAMLVAISSDTVREALDTSAFAWAATVGALTWIALATVAVLWPSRDPVGARVDGAGLAADREDVLIASRTAGSDGVPLNDPDPRTPIQQPSAATDPDSSRRRGDR